MDSLDDDRFSWIRDPRPKAPWRIVPTIQGQRNGVAISYRRCMFLAEWCAEQFGYRAMIEHQSAEFRSESDMMLFVTFWSGVPIEKMSLEDLQKKQKSPWDAIPRAE